MEKIIIVDKTEVLQGAKGSYLKVTDKGGKTQNIFQEGLWNLFGDGMAVKLTLEQTGKWWNVTAAEAVSEALAKKAKEQPSNGYVSGEEMGMWWKELGACIRSKDIDTSKPHGKALRTFFYAQMTHVLGFEFESKGKEEITE